MSDSDPSQSELDRPEDNKCPHCGHSADWHDNGDMPDVEKGCYRTEDGDPCYCEKSGREIRKSGGESSEKKLGEPPTGTSISTREPPKTPEPEAWLDTAGNELSFPNQYGQDASKEWWEPLFSASTIQLAIENMITLLEEDIEAIAEAPEKGELSEEVAEKVVFAKREARDRLQILNEVFSRD